jgi:N-acetylmuramoyl-L-alanine amidase
VALFLLVSGILPGAPEDRRIAIYSLVANYTLPVAERNGQDYVGLVEILEPLGSVSAQATGSRWKLRFNDKDSEFTPGQASCRVAGREIELGSPFLLEKGRGLAPLASLNKWLPQILGGPVTYHENSRRLYVGNVGVHFTAQIGGSNPPSLVMDFTSPVNPRIATEPGKVQLTFTREPVMPPSALNLTFDSKSIPSAAYGESNGAVEITISTRVPLFASFSNNGRTITLSPAPAKERPAEASGAAAPAPAAGESTSPAPAAVATPAPAPQAFFAVVDASHGGDERGSAISDQLAERDVTLALALRLQQDLQAKGLPTLAIREGNVTLALEQRAILANQAKPKIYICLHASSLGTGVRLYTGLMPPGSDNSGRFLNWDTAQSSFLTLSQAVEARTADALRGRQLAVLTLTAPLRPLNNIAAPAIALELAPPASGVADINSPSYLEEVAGGVSDAVVALRAQLEGKP